MGHPISLDSRTGRPVGQLLPRTGAATANTQRDGGKGLSMTERERLAKLEGKSEAFDGMFLKMSQTLEDINGSLSKLIALEERHQALDQRHQHLRTDFSRHQNTIDERYSSLEKRLGKAENQISVGTHTRGMWEKVVLPLVASSVSGILVAASVYFVFSGGSL